MGPVLSAEERDVILSGLRGEQRLFLEEHVRRGKKTAFANELAKKKGVYYHEGLTDEQAAELIDDWMLIDYIDAGAGYRSREPQLKCECGRVLRHQYVVKHAGTGERRTFGSEHFAEHTGIPPEIVKAVLEGMRGIDYELDELLIKVRDGWKLGDAMPPLPQHLLLPDDIQAHLKLSLPLLDRQIRKINRLIEEQERDARLRRLNEKPAEVNKVQEASLSRYEEVAQIDLFAALTETNIAYRKQEQVVKRLRLSDEEKQAVQGYLADGVQSVRMICELLIRNHTAYDDRYVTGKPRIYTEICWYIESLTVRLVRADETDRFYDIS